VNFGGRVVRWALQLTNRASSIPKDAKAKVEKGKRLSYCLGLVLSSEFLVLLGKFGIEAALNLI